MPSAAIGVRIEEPFDDGVVVAGLEVIPASVVWVVVSYFCYLDKNHAEKVAIILFLKEVVFLAGTAIQGFIHA